MDLVLRFLNSDWFIILIVSFQLIAFIVVILNIKKLAGFFKNLDKITILKKEEPDAPSNYVDNLQLIGSSKEFQSVLGSTNDYLIKNKGAAANLDILKDICSRRIYQIRDSIESTITLPLYIGLFGTFVGIVIGLFGIEFQEIVYNEATQLKGTVISDDSITNLLSSVGYAMIASAIGLAFTVINNAFVYKKAYEKSSRGENDYYDYLQKELLPKLSEDVSDSLGTLKDTLDHFNNDFGENLINYKENFSLLNENLEKEKDFLDTLNKLGLNKLSKEIVDTFKNLEESKDSLKEFKEYQLGLNETLSASTDVIEKYNNVSNQFVEFNLNLEKASSFVVESSRFNSDFKKYLEQHFETFENRNDMFSSSINKLDESLTEKLREYNDTTSKVIEISSTQIKNSEVGLSAFVENISSKSEEAISKISDNTIEEFKKRLKIVEDQKNDFQYSLNELNKDFLSKLDFVAENHKKGVEDYNESIENQHGKYVALLDNVENQLLSKVRDYSLNSLEQREQFNKDWRSTMDSLIEDVKSSFDSLNKFVGLETEALIGYINSEKQSVIEAIQNNKNSFKDLNSIPEILNIISSSQETTQKYQQNVSTGIENLNSVLEGDQGIYEINKNLVEIQGLLIQLNNKL